MNFYNISVKQFLNYCQFMIGDAVKEYRKDNPAHFFGEDNKLRANVDNKSFHMTSFTETPVSFYASYNVQLADGSLKIDFEYDIEENEFGFTVYEETNQMYYPINEIKNKYDNWKYKINNNAAKTTETKPLSDFSSYLNKQEKKQQPSMNKQEEKKTNDVGKQNEKNNAKEDKLVDDLVKIKEATDKMKKSRDERNVVDYLDNMARLFELMRVFEDDSRKI